MAPKIEKFDGKSVIQAKTRVNSSDPHIYNSRWWALKKPEELSSSLFGVVKFLKDRDQYRQKMAAFHSRLYGNMPLYSFLGASLTRTAQSQQTKFPSERPTMNVVQSCVDAWVSRMVQSKPKPMFLTAGGDYRNRKLAKDLNKFTEGEFYQTHAYEKNEDVLRDSAVLGDGILKVYETSDHKVGLERTLGTELFCDESDGKYRYPQSFYQLAIVNRDIAAEMFPDNVRQVEMAQSAFFDASTDSKESITSQIMVVEAWHLKSGAEATDGRHVIAIDGAVPVDENYEEDDFPFVRYGFAPRTMGYWSQGLAEQLMGTQNEINRLLYIIQKGLHLCGVPHWLIEDGSKVVPAHLNNMPGSMIKYQGVKPELATFQVFPPELYGQLERLVNYAYQQSGVSAMSAASQKPAGLNSGIALREYDDLQSDRFAYMSQRYERFCERLAYKMFRQAQIIADREGKYETVYPGKGSVFKLDIPKLDPKKDPFIIQNLPASALSKDPAERKQEIVDMMQAGLIEPQEGRRLLDYPDLQQEEELVNAPEERVLKILDEIVEDGKYTPPDPQMPLPKAKQLVIQYYNKFIMEDLEEDKAQMLLNFSVQLDALQQAATPPAPPQGAPPPQSGKGVPMPPPQSPMIPNVGAA